MLHTIKLRGTEGVIVWMTFIFLCLAEYATSHAAVIQSVPNIPLSNPASAFDASHPGNLYALVPPTTLGTPGPSNYDVRDIFGGSFGTFAPEAGAVLFADNQPIGTVDSVAVTLASPVSISSFSLWVNDDGSGGGRSISEFKLFADNALIDDITILDGLADQSYSSVYGGDAIQISDTLLNAPTTDSYTLEFVQNENAGGNSGPRIGEFEAVVPEPASFSLLALAAMGCLYTRQHGRA